MPDTTNDIDDLLGFLALAQDARYTYSLFNDAGRWHAALSALVEERNALRQRVAELEAASQPADRDLRERTDTMVRWMDQVTAMICHSLSHSHDARQELVNRYCAAIASMRKESTNG